MLKYYAFVEKENIIGCSQCPVSGKNIKCIEITQEIFDNINQYMYKRGKIVINPDWEEEQAKEARIQEIYARLIEIDNKSIRAIRANDTDYIEAYEQEAIALREELRGLINDDN